MRRGKDWKWGTQDHVDGKEGIGTITRCNEDENGNVVKWAKVLWDGGICQIYRIGAGGYFDLFTLGMYLKPYLKSKYNCIFILCGNILKIIFSKYHFRIEK